MLRELEELLASKLVVAALVARLTAAVVVTKGKLTPAASLRLISWAEG